MRLFPTQLARKIFFVLRFGRMWPLTRRLMPRSRHVARFQAIVQNAMASESRGEHRSFSAVDAARECVVMPYASVDGVGVQAMIRINLMFLASRNGVTYIHMPFTQLAHQDIDPLGKSMSTSDWAAKWEAFFNFGKDEIQIGDWAESVGAANLAEYLAINCRHVVKAKYAFQDVAARLVDKIRGSDMAVNGVFEVDLGVCTLPPSSRILLDAAFVQVLREKFKSNEFRPEIELYDDEYLNVAVHIRRGDAWEAVQAGSEMAMYTSRLVDEDYYVDLLLHINEQFGQSEKPLRFHIFSDGRREDFQRFSFSSEVNATLGSAGEVRIDDIHFHLRHDTIGTLHHLITAPILVPGKSSFGVVAAVLNDSFVLCPDEIFSFYQYNALERLTESSPRYIGIGELAERADYVIDTLQGLNPG